VARLGLKEINGQTHKSLKSFIEAGQILEGLVQGIAGYADIWAVSTAVQTALSKGRRQVPRDYQIASGWIERERDALPFNMEGPLWYRGNSLENERIERTRIDEVLLSLEAKAVVVGHTITSSREVTSRLSGKLYRTDVGMAYGGDPFALIIEDSQFVALKVAESKTVPPQPEGPQHEKWARNYRHLPDEQLKEFLLNAQIANRKSYDSGSNRYEIWEMKRGGNRLRAVFKDIAEDLPGDPSGKHASRYHHDWAAYWLDRKLGLEMIPTTVLRSDEGRSGAVRIGVESAVDLVSIKNLGGLLSDSEDEIISFVVKQYDLDPAQLREQAMRGRIFDALISVEQRKDEGILLIPEEGSVFLVDHDRSFPVSTEISSHLVDPCGPMDAELELALRSLDLDEILAELAGFLSKTQAEALLTRRDKILETCSD
jgi:hypothetical protein